jgi:GNAT superfamily N-acetyltransferase
LGRLHTWCTANDIRFLSARVPALNLPAIHALEHGGFRYIETWIYNKCDLGSVDESAAAAPKPRVAQPDDCDVMVDYSRDAFVTQRFHADPHIAPQKAESLYEKWILTAFSDPQQRILVLDMHSRPVAFVIYHTNDLRQYLGRRYATWTMVLVDPASRAKGLGTGFFNAFLTHHKREGLDVVDSGVSMRNLPSLNFFTKLNFKIVSTVVTYHRWIR